MTWIRDLIKQAVGDHVATVDDLEGRLDTARDYYRDLKEKNETLRQRLAQYEDIDESEVN